MYHHINKNFSDWIALLAMSRAGLVVVVFWAMAEATFWFIAPDFILGILIAFAPQAWKRLLLGALVGSFLGGIISLVLNHITPAWMAVVLSNTPFVQQHMIAFVESVYSKHGYIGVLFQAFSFMQFKIWTHLAVLHGFNPALYLALVMVSRTIRFGVAAVLAKEIGKKISNFLIRHAILFTSVYTCIFIALLVILEG